MKILVVTPTLGRSPWLAETVAHLATLPLALTHVLVTPPAVVPDLHRQFPSVRVIAEPGGGMYAAINAGLEAVRDWAAFTYLNDDDLLRPGFARAVAALAAGEANRPRFVYGGVELIDSRGQRLGAIPVSHRPGQNRLLYAQRLEPVAQQGTLVNRAAWRFAGGFDPEFRRCGDSEFLARLCQRGVAGEYVPGTLAAFRLHPGQLTKARAEMRAERDRVDVKLGLRTAPGRGRFWARCCFRGLNLPVYAERIARHGWITFDQLLERS